MNSIKPERANTSGNWTKTPNSLLFDNTLSDAAFRLYIQLVSINGTNLSAPRYTKQAKMALWRGCTVRQVRNILSELERAGLIYQEVRGKGQTNLIHLLCKTEE